MSSWKLGGVMLAAMLATKVAATAFDQPIPGDLDANHEVSLSDVTNFVGCLGGPEHPSVDPLCVAALFDADDDVDLRDVAGFQNRFGFGVGPPRIDRLWPTPGTWIVDDVGLTQVQVGFSEPVVASHEAIIVWLVSRGLGDNRVEEFTHSYDAASDSLTIMFDPPIRDDRVTLMLDYLIEDLSGRPLDGEIFDPLNASLPSGDGHNGGQAVFRINVLQGDANRDGVVDKADAAIVKASLGICGGEMAFDPDADLNRDGCVDADDGTIALHALGRELPQLDDTQPRVIGVYADGNFGAFDTLSLLFDKRVDGYKANERSCFLLDANDNVIVPAFYGWGAFGDVLDFYIEPTFAHCNLFHINLSNAIVDLSGELLEPMTPCTCLVDCPR
jgi:hypothetical protein